MKSRLSAIPVAAGFLAAMTTLASAETKLLLSTFFPTAHPLYAEILVPWAEAVKTETDGRVTVEFAPSSLAPPPGQLDMVESGVADIAVQYSSVVPNRLAPLMISEVPGPESTAENRSVALWRTFEDKLDGLQTLRRLKILSAFVFPDQWFFNVNDEPIETMEQLKSAQVATTPGNTATAYGAITSGVVAVPAFRYFELVSKGMVDAYTTITPLDVPSFNLENYTKSGYSMGDLSTAGSFVLVMNSAKWDQLSPEDQAIVEELSGEAFARRLSALDDRVKAVTQKFEEGGIVLSTLPEAMATGMKDAFAFIEEQWIEAANAAGIDAAETLESYRKHLAELNAQ